VLNIVEVEEHTSAKATRASPRRLLRRLKIREASVAGICTRSADNPRSFPLRQESFSGRSQAFAHEDDIRVIADVALVGPGGLIGIAVGQTLPNACTWRP
jgi:hypothetical protein